jgi:hypothetical protein
LFTKSQATNPDFGQVGHALRDASQDKSQAIKTIHRDRMPRKMYGPKSSRLKISTDIIVAHAVTTLTSLCEETHFLGNQNEDRYRDSEHHVDEESHREIDRESMSKIEVDMFSSAAAASSNPTQVTRATIEITEGVFTGEDCSPYKELQNLSQSELSCSSLDAYLDVVNDMNADELDLCLVIADDRSWRLH